MTDKQIIIDGVDVSGCPCIQSNNIGDVVCVRLARTSLYCEGQPCYYKALERKEQECKNNKIAYQMELDILNQECFNLQEELKETFDKLDQLKAEVKSKTEYIQEQRDIINQYSKEIEMYKKCQGKRASKREEELKAERDSYIDKYFLESQKVVNLRKVLREIKEIAEWCQYGDCHECKYQSRTDCRTELIVQILQKISECEGNDE